MSMIGPHCHELRIPDEAANWRIVYRVDADAIVIAEVFRKTTQATPYQVIERAQGRFQSYDRVVRGEKSP
jgi:phage-related protein